MVGDPPSMILAGYLKLTFNDFFVYTGKPGIFFAVQAGAVAAGAVTVFLLRTHREAVAIVPVEKVRSWVPSMLRKNGYQVSFREFMAVGIPFRRWRQSL